MTGGDQSAAFILVLLIGAVLINIKPIIPESRPGLRSFVSAAAVVSGMILVTWGVTALGNSMMGLSQ